MARRVQRLGPGGVLAAGFDWTGRTGRAGMALAAAVAGGLALLLALGPARIDGWSRLHETVLKLPLALLLVPAVGHAVRRLNDMGWRAGWAWLLLVPWARLVLVALLMALPPSQRRRRPGAFGRVVGMGAAGAAAAILLASLLWTTAPVLAGGMKPALLPGDLALVRRAPVALARGDVVAFRTDDGTAGTAPRMGRLIGLGGERVALVGGVPLVDGTPAEHVADGFLTEVFGPQGPLGVLPVCGNGAVGLGADCATRAYRETLPGGATHAVLDAGDRPLDRMAEVLVPAGHLFVLGDHRDAAQDSRLAPGARGAGMVPEDRVLGRVDRVLASTAAAAWDPRGWRWGRTLGRVE